MFAITGPSLPYSLYFSAMAKSPDGNGVLLFGGFTWNQGNKTRIMELRAGADSWTILDVTLQEARSNHIVISFP